MSDAPDLEDNRPLTAKEVESSLSTLGHNVDGLVVFVQSSLSSLGLTSVQALSCYRHLQHLSLDNNALASLRPLRELHSLVYCSAEDNKLSDDVFDDLAASGDTLEELRLSRNCLSDLSGLRKLPFLIEFSADENGIVELCEKDFHGMYALTRLDLRSNQIERVHLNAFAGCVAMRTLLMSHNEVSNVRFVLHLSCSLEKLDLEHNKVEALDGLKYLNDVVYLNLAHNRIHAWEELRALSSLMNLRVLMLEGNPILRVEIPRQTVSSAWQVETVGHVARDVTFTATARSGLLTPTTATPTADTLLSSMVAPSARGRVQHVAAAPQETAAWDDDNLAERLQLAPEEERHLRVVCMLQQLQRLDAAEVTPDMLTRAARLFGKRRKGVSPAGSAVKAVESKRSKGCGNGNASRGK